MWFRLISLFTTNLNRKQVVLAGKLTLKVAKQATEFPEPDRAASRAKRRECWFKFSKKRAFVHIRLRLTIHQGSGRAGAGGVGSLFPAGKRLKTVSLLPAPSH